MNGYNETVHYSLLADPSFLLRERQSEIVVPARFFKVVAVPYTGTPRGIAFIFDNEAEQPSLKELAITIDSVERVTGIDFFHNLPDSIEHKIESDLSLEIWNLN